MMTDDEFYEKYQVAKEEHVIKHLEMLEDVIKEHSRSALTIRGSLFLIISMLFVSSNVNPDSSFLMLAFFPIIGFWLLDSYHFKKRRLFEKRFDKVREKHFSHGEFLMAKINKTDTNRSYLIDALDFVSKWSVFCSPAAILLYLPAALLVFYASGNEFTMIWACLLNLVQ